MSNDRSLVRCGIGAALAYGLAATLAALLSGCSAEAPRSAAAMPFVTNSIVAARHAGKPRFLHEYPLPMGTYPSSIIAGPDGAMWFGTYPLYTFHPATHLGIWRIALGGKKHYFPFENGVYDVAPGADGRVWFTNPYENPYNVGAIARHGKITTYSQPSDGSPESIAADASGHLWYTSFGGYNDIVEMDTNGQTVATFKAKHGFADKLAYGNTGAIWFNTVANPSKIGRITLKGNQVSAPIGGPNYIPGRMALGPDGRMWMCDGDALAAVDRRFNVTLYTLASSGTFAGVTAGPDGNMWGAESQHGHIVRVTTSGTMTEYVPPTPNMLPTSIATGPDHNIWFTEIQNQTDVTKIGVLRP
jgi:streptogramin lyase